MTIRAVLFDADGVLQHQAVTLHSVLSDVLALPPGDVDDCYREVWEAEGPALMGQGGFVEAMSDLLVKWGRPGRVDAFIDASKTIRTDEAVAGIVRRLRAGGILCCLASNQVGYRARYMSETLGYADLFDREFYSCDIGRKKPEPAYFEAILERVAPPPADVLFIDDHDANVAAALDLGMTAAVFQPDPGVEPHRLMREILAEHGVDASHPIL